MYGRVRGKTDIRPTYRVTIPDEDTPFSPGFAQRPKKWTLGEEDQTVEHGLRLCGRRS